MTAPTIADLVTSVTFAENTVNTAAQVIDSTVTFTATDDAFDGGFLRVTGLLAEDAVSVRNQGNSAGQIGFSGGIVSYGGIAIGTGSGGDGATFTVTFNASATALAIDALIQNLTYANSSDTPTPSRILSLTVTNAAGESADHRDFVAMTGASNPFKGSDVGFNSAVAFADLDNDGDLDMASGDADGNVHYFRNTGTWQAPVFSEVTGSANPFNGINVGLRSTATLRDLDGDGDADLIVGESDGLINYFKNTGTASAPVFTAQLSTANPFNGIDVGSNSATTFGDLDGDGDLDMVVGNLDGTLQYFENTGTASAPAFTEQTGSANPFNGVDVGGKSMPTLGDVDLDGDLDLIVGEQTASSLNTFLNTGTSSAPVFVEQTGAANPFAGFVTETDSAPTFVDLNGDGRLDLAVAGSDGNTGYIENQSFSDPVDGIDVGFRSAAAFGDLDGDGDLDMVVGESNGGFLSYKNTGTGSGQGPIYVQQTGAANPLNGADVGLGSTPVLVDLDGDGDLDLVSGENDGNLNYYKNTGTASAPVFTLQSGADDPFDGIDPSSFSKPTFGDLDGDGDKDMLFGLTGGNVLYYQNVGTATAPAFSQASISGLADVGSYSAPALGDVDGDGDLDLAVAESTGAVHYFENTGTTAAPIFVERTGTQNPFSSASGASIATLADLDKDGDLDLVIGTFGGRLSTIENTAAHLTVTVTAQNDAPVAEATSFAAGEGGDVSSNVTATDADGSIASFVLDTTTAKGTLDFGSDGYFSFGAGSDFEALGDGETEQVSFTYHAVDDQGASSAVETATITVTGANDLPELGGMTTAKTFAENAVNATPEVIDASVTLTDPEGDFAGGGLTVSGLLAEDIIGIQNQGSGAGQIGISGGTVSYGGVVIGTAAGGHGDDLVVTFNANATTAAVEALAEALTYANTSDTATATRTIEIKIADASGGTVPMLDAQTGAANPFAGIDSGDWNAPALGDLDGDGDLDLIVGTAGGGLRAYINTGTQSSPDFAEVTGSANPLNGIDLEDYASPALADVDGDGDLDLVAGGYGGRLHYFENTGTSAAPVFVERTGAANPFDAVNVAGSASAAFGDLDGDGDLDLAVSGDREVSYFENTGSATIPAFTQQTGADNPFDGFALRGVIGAPISLADLDGDGDLDLAAGTEFRGIDYFQNTGTETDPAYVTPHDSESPFYGVAYGATGPAPGEINVTRGAVALADLDGDGDVDALLAGSAGVGYAENTGTEVTITVTAENDAPVAAADTETTPADAVFNGSVPAASDADNAIASYVLDTGVATGRLTFKPDGTYTYNPDAQFSDLLPGESADVTFTYHAVDASGASSNVATVTITVTGTDQAPLITEVAAGATFAENTVNASGQIIDANIRLVDREGDFTGGTLTVTGLLAEDTVSIQNQGTSSGQIGVSGANVTYGGVVIGTVAGGAGASLVVTFNANASTVAVEALVEHLTYANGSNAPTATRTLSLTLTDTDGNAARFYHFEERTGGDNPVNFSPGQLQKPVFVDLDHDGDLDMVTGRIEGTLSYFENTGSATDPVYTQRTSTANPFNGIDIGDTSAPALGDLDDDGDLDLIVGTSTGTFAYYKNTGSTSAPAFTLQSGAANPMNGVDLPSSAEPALVDLDHDGDFDLVVGTGNGNIQYFKNTGTDSAPTFTQQTGATNPFDGIDVGSTATPTFADMDQDGDLDMIVGESDGVLNYFENTGSVSAPAFTQRNGEANPLSSIGDVGSSSAPAVVDIDGDGDLDVVIGQQDIAPIVYFENTSPTTQEITVTVTAENDAPTATDSDGATTEAVVLAGTVTATDADGTIATYLLDADVAKGTLTFNSDGTWSFDPSGAFQALAPGETEDVTFTWHGVDNGGASTGIKTVTITVTGTIPSIDDLATSITFSEAAVNGGPQRLDTDITLSDAAGSFDGGSLTVSGLLAEDIVSVRNQGTGTGEIGLSDDTVTYGGIAIGTAAGGNGGTFVVAFNASATPEAIEALVENLTYANGSDAPTASRTLSLSLSDGTTGFHDATGPANPYAGIAVGNYQAPHMADIDGDGDLDLVLGNSQDGLSFFENTGTASDPAFTARTGTENPFDGLVGGGLNAIPALVDIDDDGDLDLVVGTYASPVTYFENTGTATDPVFTSVDLASSPFAGVTAALGMDYNAPTFADLDGDGDSDLIVGTLDGTLHSYENTGTVSAAAFVERTGPANPFDGIDVGDHAKPAFADLDGDGDLDLLVGTFDGTVRTFENNGSDTAPHFVELTGAANPLDGVDVGSYAAPDLADLDGDGDLDVVLGSYGDTSFLINDPPATSEITVTVTADNDGPAASDDAGTTGEGSVLAASVPAASDADGTIASYALVSSVAKGTLTFNSDGSYSFDPDGEFEGLGTGDSEQVTFTYKAIDNEGAESTAKTVTITVTGVNDLPVASDDAGTTSEGSVLSGSVPAASDVDGTITSYALVSNVAKGVLTFNSDGSYSFDPDGDFEGLGAGDSEQVTFTYKAIDNDGGESTAKTVTITVTGVNDAPVASNDGKTTGEGSVLSGSVPAASDVDGTIVGYALITDVAKGGLTFNSDGTYSFDPDGDFEGLGTGGSEEVTFTYKAIDNDGGESTARTVTITVTGVNDAPQLHGLAHSLTVAENTANATPQLIDANADLTDPEGNFDGGTVTVSGLLAEDVVAIRDFGTDAGEIGYSGGIVTYGGVAIGTAAGGEGDTFIVTLNGNATTEAVEALIENLTYANTSDTPTGSRTLTLAVVDGEGASTPTGPFTEQTGSANPFAGIDVGDYSAPAFADIDGDHDLDLVVGTASGALRSFENTGSGFIELTGGDNPLSAVSIPSSYAMPTFVDLDGDGDLDLVVGAGEGELYAFENTGSGFAALTGTDSRVDGIDAGQFSAPAFGDFDGDGDQDMAVGNFGGGLAYYENTGTAAAPVFVEKSGAASPFDGIDVGNRSTPAVSDVDGDGDLDVLIGERDGDLVYIENTGTPTSPNFVRTYGSDNPFADFGTATASYAVPVFADVDGDGDQDLAIGHDGEVAYIEASPNTSVTIEVTAENDVPVASNDGKSTGEGSVLSGSVPAVTDVDGTIDSYALVTDVAKGALTFNADGTYSFDPDGDFEGLGAGDSEQVAFTYTAIDNDGGESTAKTVTITVTGVNDVPVASNDGKSTGEGSVLSGSVPAATDIDGVIAGYALVADVAKGALTFNSDGTYSFDPDGDFEALGTGDSEQVAFTYKAIDNDGGESTAKTVTITVTGVNDVPVASNDGKSTGEGSVLSGSVPAATDADGTIASYALVSDVAKGALTFNSDGTYSFDPDGDFEALGTGDSEQVAFTYTAIDNDGGESTAKTVTITVSGVNDVPVASNDGKSTGEGSVLSGSVPAATDMDGVITGYALISDVAKGTLTFNSDGTYSFDPDGDFEALGTGDSEQVAFTYKAIDNDGGESTAKTVTITVTGSDETGGGRNSSPAMTSGTTFAIAENSVDVARIAATDADGDTLAFSIAGGSDALLFAIDAATGALSFKAAPDFEQPGDAAADNAYHVVVAVSDGTDSTESEITVNVQDIDGAAIAGTRKKDIVDGGRTVKGQTLPTAEEDSITGKKGKDKLSGLGGNDTLDGGKDKDKLSGGDGDDDLIGGKTKDKLSGGAGSDSFVFNAKLKANTDKIVDFQAGADRIVLDDMVFKALAPGALPIDALVFGTKAKDDGDHVIYNARKGLLLYDADGKGGVDAVAFAKLGKGLDLHASDFLVI